jgi:WYL domain
MEMEDFLETIEKAINDRSLLQVVYPPGVRLIEPHAVGLSSDGNMLVRAYQVDGASRSGEHEHWKLFRVDRLTSVVLLPIRFPGARPGYKSGDKAMKGGVLAEV